MKNALLIILLKCLSISLFSQSWTRPENAAKHKGDIINMVGFISNIKFVTESKNPSIVMTVNQKDSTRSLSLVMSKAVSEEYIEDLKLTYLNQYVQVKGKVETYSGRPYIIINSKNQIAIVKEDLRRIQFWEPE